MKLKEENIVKLIKDFEPDKLDSVILLYGKENFLKKQFVDKIKYLTPEGFHFLWGDETTLERLKETFSSSSLFSSGETVVLWNLEDFLKNLNKNSTLEFLKLAKAVSLPNRLILVSTKDKLPKKEPYKTLLEISEVIVSPPLTSRAFMVSVKKKIKRENLSIDDETLLYLVSKLKNDLYYTKQEVEKLLLFAKDKKHITKEDIDIVVVPAIEDNVFQFVEKFFSKDKESVKILRELIETSHHPFEIQSLLLTYLNRILMYKELKGKNQSEDTIFSKIGINHPFMKSVIKKLSNAVEADEVIELIRELYNLEIKQKVNYEDPVKSLEEFVTKWVV